jgi:hypothetical protein
MEMIEMAGLEDLIGVPNVGSLFSASSTLPIMLFLLIGGILAIVLYCRSTRRWLWYWRGATRAQVLNREGNGFTNPKPDRIRETDEGGRIEWESERWGDKFDATHLKKAVIVGQGARGGVLKDVFLMRQAPLEWSEPTYVRESFKVKNADGTEEIKERIKLTPMMCPGMKIALANAIVRKTKRSESQSWFEKNAGIIGFAILGLFMFITIVVLIQFATAQFSAIGGLVAQASNELAQSNRLLTYALNATGALPTPIPGPPG